MSVGRIKVVRGLLVYVALGVVLGAVSASLLSSPAHACICADATWTMELVSIEGDEDPESEAWIWDETPWLYGAPGWATYYDGRIVINVELDDG